MTWKLLLVDDEPCIRELLTELLSDDDVSVTTAKNGIEGLTLLEKESFDIIVTDINMPGLDGISMIKEARALGIFTPYIYFSAQSNFKNLDGSLFVGKPYFERLTAEINSILVRAEFMTPKEKSFIEVFA